MKSYRESRPFHRFVRWTATPRLMTRIYGVIEEPIDRVNRGAVLALPVWGAFAISTFLSGLLQRPAGRALNVASPWQTQPTSCGDEP
jgi:hypothetical protein